MSTCQEDSFSLSLCVSQKLRWLVLQTGHKVGSPTWLERCVQEKEKGKQSKEAHEPRLLAARGVPYNVV